MPARQVVADQRLRLLVGRPRAGAGSPRACRRSGPPPRRGPASRSTATSSGDLEVEHDVELPAELVEHRVERLGLRRSCAGSRRGRSRASVSSCDSRSRMSSIDQVVGDEVAGVEDRLDLAARARVPAAIAARSMSPVAIVRDAVLGGDARRPACPCRPRAAPRMQKVERHAALPIAGSLRSGASSSATPSGASCRARRRPRSGSRCRRAQPRSTGRSRRSG